ncbi:M56 family metallopeptidase [Streptomyces sp. NPDC001985]|uniref:M56 family metallopeptidase n=1 Tax=Streptomyces sp. NPDC001985 TaxID=3154406 RepID=UPI00331E0EA6
MSTVLASAGYALLAGAVAPYALVRAGWTHRAPAAAVLAWQALALSFVVATALAVCHLLLAGRSAHQWLTGLLSACGEAVGAAAWGSLSPAGASLLLVPAGVVLLPLGLLAGTAWRARRERRRHADLLLMIGTEAPGYGATVVEHAVPAVYCLPGRDRRVVVTRGALDVLTGEQVRAVLAHERAHLRGRHHLPLLAAGAFAAAFPGLPLARRVRGQTALLLEMAADDRALRSHSRDALATALCEVAAGRAPRAGLGAGGPDTLVRLHRILDPQAGPSRAARLGIVAASFTAPVLPLLLGCGPL